MELIGEVAINASRERVWAALNDVAVLQACIPGCEEVVDESPEVRRARVLIKVGPVRARFAGKITLSNVAPPMRCTLGFEGSGGAAGMASGQSQVELHEEAGETRLAYSVKAAVGGKLGQIGGRMIDASAKQLADQFFHALRLHITSAGAPLSVSQPQLPAGLEPVESTASAAAASQHSVPSLHVKAPAAGEIQRVLWFLLGAGSTAFGVWLGKVLF